MELTSTIVSIIFLSLTTPALSEQPVVDTATATEQAKQLVKSGAISAIKAETKNSGFKRSRTLEGKLKVSTSSIVQKTLDFREHPSVGRWVWGKNNACSDMDKLLYHSELFCVFIFGLFILVGGLTLVFLSFGMFYCFDTGSHYVA
jgi:hypothetical protein